MNRAELREIIFESADQLGIEISLDKRALLLIGLELLSDDQVAEIGSSVESAVAALKIEDYDALRGLILDLGGDENTAEELIDYVRAGNLDRDE